MIFTMTRQFSKQVPEDLISTLPMEVRIKGLDGVAV
jgi:hypothetical protein